jgi:hypothetical protein
VWVCAVSSAIAQQTPTMPPDTRVWVMTTDGEQAGKLLSMSPSILVLRVGERRSRFALPTWVASKHGTHSGTASVMVPSSAPPVSAGLERTCRRRCARSLRAVSRTAWVLLSPCPDVERARASRWVVSSIMRLTVVAPCTRLMVRRSSSVSRP